MLDPSYFSDKNITLTLNVAFSQNIRDVARWENSWFAGPQINPYEPQIFILLVHMNRISSFQAHFVVVSGHELIKRNVGLFDFRSTEVIFRR